MALGTATIQARHRWNDGFMIRMTFLGDDDYPAGGTADFLAYVKAAIAAYNAALADASVRGPENVQIVSLTENYSGVYHPRYDFANDKLMMLTAALVDATPGDLSGTTVDIVLFCK